MCFFETLNPNSVGSKVQPPLALNSTVRFACDVFRRFSATFLNRSYSLIVAIFGFRLLGLFCGGGQGYLPISVHHSRPVEGRLNDHMALAFNDPTYNLSTQRFQVMTGRGTDHEAVAAVESSIHFFAGNARPEQVPEDGRAVEFENGVGVFGQIAP